jgi:hypothetical protein
LAFNVVADLLAQLIELETLLHANHVQVMAARDPLLELFLRDGAFA